MTFMASWYWLFGGSSLTPYTWTSHLLVIPTIAILVHLARRASHDQQTRIREIEVDLQQQASALAQSLRLSTIGQGMASVAHEIRQPLTVIMNLSQLLGDAMDQRPTESSPEMRGQVAEIQAQTQRVAAIVRRIRSFTRRDDQERMLENVNEVIQEAIVLVQFLADRQSAPITKALLPHDRLISLDRLQIQQVIVNLLVNALESLRDAQIAQPTVHLQVVDLSDGIEIRVEDNGPGISAKAVDVFAPFVSSKKDGTGLGLSICRAIVEAYGGHLQHIRVEGGRTCFCFTLPDERRSDEGLADYRPSADADRSDVGRGLFSVLNIPPARRLLPHWHQERGETGSDTPVTELPRGSDRSSPRE